MSRTKRIYNSWRRFGKTMRRWHPYASWCMGNCQYCRRLDNRNRYHRHQKRSKFDEALRLEHPIVILYV